MIYTILKFLLHFLWVWNPNVSLAYLSKLMGQSVDLNECVELCCSFMSTKMGYNILVKIRFAVRLGVINLAFVSHISFFWSKWFKIKYFRMLLMYLNPWVWLYDTRAPGWVIKLNEKFWGIITSQISVHLNSQLSYCIMNFSKVTWAGSIWELCK